MTTRTKSPAHPHAALPDAGSGSLISNARLIEIYAAMLRCRMLRVRTLARPGKLRNLVPGSEAVAAAAAIGLLPEDTILSPVPHLLAALVKGVPAATLLRAAAARPSSSSAQDFSAKGVLAASFTGTGPGDASVGALAAGAAFAGKLGNRCNVCLVFHDYAGAESSWRDVFELALTHNLPVIFVRQSPFPLPPAAKRGKSSGRSAKDLPVIPVDANDAVAVYRVAYEAIAHARRGSGPTLIDCVSLRVPGERKQDSDCIARMERYLAAKRMRPERIQGTVTAKFSRALDAAAVIARRGPRVRRNVRGRE
jgi:TPP-dependent pyruvate/acetoin dehydrogenase alpha subunit